MKVLRLHGMRHLHLHDEPNPVPGPGEVLLRVSAVGLCGSDLQWLSEAAIGDAQLEKPLVLGHEFAGIIANGARRGERVAVDPAIPCGACEFCKEGNPNLCAALHFAGHGTEDGALREYLTWPSRCLHPLPDALMPHWAGLADSRGPRVEMQEHGIVEFGDGQLGIFH